MKAAKVQAKIFIESPVDLDVAPLVPVFHEWIQKNALGELLIDVTEYGHVHEAQSLLLIGGDSDYSIDFGEGRPGLLSSRKRNGPSDPRESFPEVIRRALNAARRLEGESAISPPIRFRGDELVLRVNDRLNAPNTRETVAALKPLLEEILRKLYGSARFTVEAFGEPRDLVSFRAKAEGAPSVTELLSRIS